MPDIETVKGPLAISIVASKAFDCLYMADIYRQISDDTGLDFRTITDFLDRMPIFLNGAAHKTQRATLAARLAQRVPAIDAELGQKIDQIAEEIRHRDGSFDVLQELGHPIWQAVSRAILAHRLDDMPDLTDLPLVLSPYTPLLKRVSIEARLRMLVEAHGADILDELTLVTLGAGPIINGFALSVHDLVTRHAGYRLDQITYPAQFPKSALRFVHRIATTDQVIADTKIPSGARKCCVIFDESYPVDQNTRNLYGVGAHTCLGRRVAMQSWTGLCRALSQIPNVVQPGPLRVQSREPFDTVSECQIHLTPSQT